MNCLEEQDFKKFSIVFCFKDSKLKLNVFTYSFDIHRSVCLLVYDDLPDNAREGRGVRKEERKNEKMSSCIGVFVSVLE